jgi:hypothetical protein
VVSAVWVTLIISYVLRGLVMQQVIPDASGPGDGA